MTLDFVVWLIAFVLQSALLGKSMFTLIALSDLENDNTNPFDCADQINRFVLPEYVGQAALTLVLLASRNWLVVAVQVGVSAYLVHLYLRKRVYLHAADAFKQLPSFKKIRTWVFGIQCACFLIVTYGMIEAIIHSVLTPQGRETAKKLFTDSHHFLHY